MINQQNEVRLLKSGESLLDVLKKSSDFTNANTLLGLATLLTNISEETIRNQKRNNDAISFLNDTIVCSDANVLRENDLTTMFFQAQHRESNQYTYEILKPSTDSDLQTKSKNVQDQGKQGLNIFNKYLISNEFEFLNEVIGSAALQYIYSNFLIFLKREKFYIQICGTSIAEYFSRRSNLLIRPKAGVFTKKQQYLPRINHNQVFYSTYMSRSPGLFKKSELNMALKEIMQINSNQKLIEDGFCFVNQQHAKQGAICNLMKPIKQSKQQYQQYQQPQYQQYQQPRKTAQQVYEYIVESHFCKGLMKHEVDFAVQQKYMDIVKRMLDSLQRKVNFNAMITKCNALPKTYAQLKQRVGSVLMRINFNKANETAADEARLIEVLFEDLFIESCDSRNVARFVKAVLKKIIPVQLYGAYNYAQLLQRAKEFVLLKRFENYSIIDITATMKVLAQPILQQDNRSNNGLKQQLGFKLSRTLLSNINIFVFNEIIIPLLRNNFYATEKHAEGSRIFYYRKPLWNLISKLAISQFERQNMHSLSDVEQEAIAMQIKAKDATFKAPIAKLRVLPKKNSFRPIMTFNNKQGNKKLTYNKILEDAQLVLRNLKDVLGYKLGYSVFDNGQVFEKFVEFKRKLNYLNQQQNLLKQNSSDKQSNVKLYFVTLDISKCYDSINTQRLINMLENTDLVDGTYLLNKYTLATRNKRAVTDIDNYDPKQNMKQLQTSNSKSKNNNQILKSQNQKAKLQNKINKSAKNAKQNQKLNHMHNQTATNIESYFNIRDRENSVPLMRLDDVNEYFHEKNAQNKVLVVVDKSQHKLVSKDDIMMLLRNVCNNQLIIKFGRRYFKQKRGIPQGLNVSSVLSSFYYSILEDQYYTQQTSQRKKVHKQENDCNQLGLNCLNSQHSQQFSNGYQNSQSQNASVLMRLTDDYLFITTSQQEALQFITLLQQCAEANEFAFNKEKMHTNFPLPGQSPEEFAKENLQQIKWIGKCINIETCEMAPHIKFDKDECYYQVNVNLQRRHLKYFLRNKLKSFLMNHFSYYYSDLINGEKKKKEILKLFAKASVMKFFPFIDKLCVLKFKKITNLGYFVKDIVSETIAEFTLYCLYLRGANQATALLHQKQEYSKIYKTILKQFVAFFETKKSRYLQVFKALKLLQKQSSQPMIPSDDMEIENINTLHE